MTELAMTQSHKQNHPHLSVVPLTLLTSRTGIILKTKTSYRHKQVGRKQGKLKLIFTVSFICELDTMMVLYLVIYLMPNFCNASFVVLI